MGLNDIDHESNADNFYSPICVSGYLTPLQRKKLREKRNTPLPAHFETDFKTPKSSKDVKKPKRTSSTKPNPKIKPPKEQQHRTKSSKENVPELRYSVASLVAHDVHNPLKEKRFFKNRSPQHLTKTEFVLPLTCKKRCLDFSSEKNSLSPPLRTIQQSTTEVKDKIVHEMEDPTSQKDRMASDKYQTIVKNSDVDLNSSGLYTPLNEECDEIDQLSTSKIEICKNGDIFDFNWPSDEELLERQNKARAEAKKSMLAYRELLNKSSSSDESLNVSLEDDPQQNTSPKLYPIFCKAKKQESNTKRPCPKTISCIRDTSRGDEQMIIDAGQKEIGSRLCKTCNMLYTIGHEEDERLHEGYHHTFLTNLRFHGWKNECIVGEFDDGRIIRITDTDKNFKLKKVQDVLTIANRDLGFTTSGFPSRPNILFYLFVSNDKRVGGCLVAEPIETACPVVLDIESGAVESTGETSIWKLGNWYASTKPVKAICGINRIWVAVEFRRQKVASRLVDCLRGSFIYGHVVDFREMAFTDPSPDGREFAASYTGTDHFLVYK